MAREPVVTIRTSDTDEPDADLVPRGGTCGGPRFFIVGSGRSGSTLLRLMIAGHSGIVIPPETWFILDLVRKLPLRGALTPAELQEATSTIIDGSYFPSLGISADELRDEALRLQAPQLVDVIDLIYRYHMRRSGKRRVGDKTPPYVEIIRELDVLYPDAKFVHLVRDGRDVAMSFIELGWGSAGRCYREDFEWALAVRRRDEYRGTAIEPRILDIRYEDLVSHPERTLREICRFLGEAFQPAMLDVAQRIDQVPESERLIHPMLARPVTKDAIGRWRELRWFECFIMEACLWRELRQWGYALRFSSRKWQLPFAATAWLLRTTGGVLTLAIPYLQRRRLLPRRLYI